jgi:hypothetical protein
MRDMRGKRLSQVSAALLSVRCVEEKTEVRGNGLRQLERRKTDISYKKNLQKRGKSISSTYRKIVLGGTTGRRTKWCGGLYLLEGEHLPASFSRVKHAESRHTSFPNASILHAAPL